MKKIAIEVLYRPREGERTTATFILPDNLSLVERIGIAKAVLCLLEEESHETTKGSH